VGGLLAEAGTPIITQAGSGPLPGSHTGPGPLAEVLARHPRLKAIVAHMGTPEYDDFLALAHRYPNVGLDTTMAFTDFVERMSPYPRELLPQLTDLGLAGKVYFGSDFPNIPYEYSHQLDSLERLGLGDDWLRAVLWGNASALFDQPGA
jgi:predicted TIM-barrel fold metal-dependent hydrolase